MVALCPPDMDEIDFGIAYIKSDYVGIKVTLNSFRGLNYVHIREYIWDPEEEIWFPTKKGYALKAEEIDSVIQLLQQASEVLAKEQKPNYQYSLPFKE